MRLRRRFALAIFVVAVVLAVCVIAAAWYRAKIRYLNNLEARQAEVDQYRARYRDLYEEIRRNGSISSEQEVTKMGKMYEDYEEKERQFKNDFPEAAHK